MDSELEIEGERKRSNLEGERLSSRLESIPRELILDIFSGLPVSSLVRFKSVCRAWRMLARDPDLVNKHSTRMADNNPCLIFHCDYPITNQLVDLPASNHEEEKVKKFHVPFWEAMPEFDVVGSSNGLLCLSDSLYNDALYVYNPFNRNYQELLKSMRYSNQDVVFGFGFHPTIKEYKVLKIVYYKKAYRGYWNPFGATNNMNSRGSNFHSGQLNLEKFGKDEQFQLVPTPLKGCNYHLVVLGGCLSAAVYCNYGKLEIWVMREYDVESSWIKKFDIVTYVPRGLEEVNQFFKISKIIWKGGFVRVLCLLKNGEILLEYKSRALVSYDPKSGEFKDLMFQGIPKWYEAVVHVGTLNWTDALVDA